MTPKRARLDADRKAKPRTKLIARVQVREGQRVYSGPATAIEDTETGERTELHISTPEEADATFGAGSEAAETAKALIYHQRGEIDPRRWPMGAVECSKYERSTRHIQHVVCRMKNGKTQAFERWSANGRWWSDWKRIDE